MPNDKGGGAVSSESMLLWSSNSGHFIVQNMGQPSVSPQKLGRELIEELEMVLLGEDPNQNRDSRSLALVGIGPSSNSASRGRGGG